jgi:hypothetical protein
VATDVTASTMLAPLIALRLEPEDLMAYWKLFSHATKKS